MATIGTWRHSESYMVPQDIDQTSTVQNNPLGLLVKARDISEATAYGTGEFIYLKGVVSTVVGSVVTYNEAHQTALIVSSVVGPVAVAMSINVAANWGWYQRVGIAYMEADAVATDKQLYIDGTAGRVDDAVVAGDMIIGAVSVTLGVSNFLDGYIATPYVSDDADHGTD